jgi:hypothetical protein
LVGNVVWCSVEDLNPGMSVCKTDAFGRLANGAW